MCEGKKTEPNYFRTLSKVYRLGNVSVEIRPSGSGTSPGRIVHFADSVRKQDGGFDEVWCVFDAETPADPYEAFLQAANHAKKKRFRLAVSNPAFEIWFLLHFRDTSRPFGKAQDVVNELKGCIPDYEKNYRGCECLIPKTDVAIERAQRLLDTHVDDCYAPNPSTYVHQLVVRLREMGSR